MDNKSDLRIRAKSIRKKLNIEQISNEIVFHIRQFELYKNAKNVLIFYPMKFEINLLELLNDNKNFYLPKVYQNELYICPFKKGDKLEKSDFNVEEPCSNPINPNILDLIFVPALLVDKNNYRLGYGGGFYDRFLAQYTQITTVVPISKDLCIEALPFQDFDVKVDYVINEKGLAK